MDNTFSYYSEINNNFVRKLFSLRVNTLKGNIILTGGFEEDGSDEGQISDKVCIKEKKLKNVKLKTFGIRDRTLPVALEKGSRKKLLSIWILSK